MTGTFVMALLGVVLSTASLAWQFMNYVLTGPRLVANMRLGVGGDDGTPSAYWGLKNDAPEFLPAAAVVRYSAEIVIVEVRNKGRSAITITSVGLAAGPNSGRFRKGATIVTADSEQVRLEPGGVHQWHTEVWPLIDRLRGLREETVLNVRGAVQLGTTRVVFSSRRDGWHVKPDQVSVVPGHIAREDGSVR